MFRNTNGECFVICKVKKVDDNYILDLPFGITSQCIIYNDACWFHQVPQIEGVEVLAHVTYDAKEDDIVMAYSGYIGDNSTPEGRIAIQEHPRFAEFWEEKNEELTDEEGKFLGYGDVVYPCVYLRPDYEDK